MTSHPRSIVSYFEHEFPKKGNIKDLQEIIDCGFNHIVLCVSEITLANPVRLKFVEKFIAKAKGQGITVWADPWGVGKVFGGEARSLFAESGILACQCNEKFDRLMKKWIDTVYALEVDGIFWDEPEIKCPNHNELTFIKIYTSYAKNLGLYNSVCMTANPKKIDVFDSIASLNSVDDIATDPYFPNVFYQVSMEERISYVEEWTYRTLLLAQKYGKDCHVWLQGFGIKKGDTSMMTDFASAVRNRGINSLAVWGFRGCETLFEKEEKLADPEEVWSQTKEVFLLSELVEV